MSLLEMRVQTARVYLEKLERSLERHWMEQFEAAQKSETWLDRLALVHPEHYVDYIKNEVVGCPIRGLRTFPKESGILPACSAHLLWQYPCTSKAGRSEADHLFPWGFGGPTVAANKIFLCHIHNGVKSGDMHLYPWEKGEPSWLAGTVNRIFRLLQTPDSEHGL